MWAIKKKLGEFSGSQLINEGRSMIPRIPTTCDESHESEYELWKEGEIFSHMINPTYMIFCKHCGDRLELEIEEYHLVMKIVKLNIQLVNETIDSEEHLIKLEKIHSKQNK